MDAIACIARVDLHVTTLSALRDKARSARERSRLATEIAELEDVREGWTKILNRFDGLGSKPQVRRSMATP